MRFLMVPFLLFCLSLPSFAGCSDYYDPTTRADCEAREQQSREANQRREQERQQEERETREAHERQAEQDRERENQVQEQKRAQHENFCRTYPDAAGCR